MFSGKPLRQFAFALLEDEFGINREVWDTLRDLLDDDNQNDIIDKVQMNLKHRYFLSSDDATVLESVPFDE